MSKNDHLLMAENINISIGDAHIVDDLSISLDEGEAVGLFGRNGVGKTTTFQGIMGQKKLTSGSIQFKNTELTDIPPEKRANLGIGYQPEDRDLFTGMTVDENLRIPIWVANMQGKSKNEERIISEVYETFPELGNFKNLNVENLSGGQAKMTSIGRALAIEPDLLLLDEPLEGLAPTIVEDVKTIVNKINDQDIAVLLAEANLAHATELVDRAYIIDRGSVYDSGRVEELVGKTDIQNLLQG